MSSPIRVRFAPSPTGYLHVGGARTALFNWLLARQTGGVFILRIEDTDLERSTAESEEGLLRDLRWLGLDWNEGPGVGGPHGPYRQSERTTIYQDAARRLMAKGAAYPCFCSEESLEAKRKQAEASGAAMHYDGTCTRLPAAEVQRRISAGEPYAIRMKVPEKDYVLDDLCRGSVEWKSENLGDFIILRSNGMPVYNFCVVVDDAEMEVTHVIRGDDHLTNTHRQLIIYEALERPRPKFAHVSMILGPDKAKLSKRHGTTSVGQYAEDGFLPEAMVNFFALLGWNEGTNQELYSRDELIQKFSIERIGNSAAVFDHAKLLWMNGEHIRKLSLDTLTQLLEPRFKKAFPGDVRFDDPAFRQRATQVIQPALKTLNDVGQILTPILHGGTPENAEAEEALKGPDVPRLLEALQPVFGEIEWKKEIINQTIKDLAKKLNIKGKALFMPIRVRLTGNCHGPDLVGIIELLGRETVLQRLKP
ncbi:MAG TPA: glutamate--tRNA ligase [Candidatus Ozemobacteraceae bacterium]|nr:glutamate--tRNA ligase [Candidatus Ozemobacteraceae bacterium]